MDSHDSTIRELRGVIRDLVALATMPAGWVGRDPAQIAASLADLLLHTLRAQTAYVCLYAEPGIEPVSALRARSHPDFLAEVNRLREASSAATLSVDSVQRPDWPSPLRIAMHPIGISGEQGFVAAGCGGRDFPSETESLLLSVTANQAAVALQSSRLLEARRSAEDALRESNRKTTQMLESISDGFISFDRGWCITYVNDIGAEFLQRPREQLIGRNLWELYPDIVGTSFESHYRAAVDRQRPLHFEEFYPALDAWFELHLYPAPEGLSIFFRNISDRKKGEEALLKAEKLAITGKMAASIAHEINNPLEAVINLLYLARISSTGDKEVQKYLETAEQEINRVSYIARQTLGFYRDSSSVAPVQLEILLRDVLAVYRSRMNSRGIELRETFAAAQPVMGLKGELHQVFANLIANATDAMEGGGVLRLHTESAMGTAGAGVKVTVADTGCGIEKQHLDQVFEPFFTTRKSVGTGLGLWVVRQIVENHGGTIRIESNTEARNHGTTVSVFLPFASAELKPLELSSVAHVN